MTHLQLMRFLISDMACGDSLLVEVSKEAENRVHSAIKKYPKEGVTGPRICGVKLDTNKNTIKFMNVTQIFIE